jgi:hypothetical protein
MKKKSRFAGILISRTPEIILAIYVILFFLVKNPADPHDRVIISDGKAYYGYLTATFIYQDLSYSFIEDYESKYYPDHPSIFKEFRYPFKGEIVNKGFPGLAFLLLPFFLIAHLLALITGLPADGYSLVYQYAMAAAALFYFWLGLRYTARLLRAFHTGPKTTAFILLLIAFATNIIYYTLKEGMMTHVYNFWLAAAFMLYLRLYFTSKQTRHILYAALIFGLIVSVRPTNGLFILLVPFVAGSYHRFVALLKEVLFCPKMLFRVLGAAMVFPFLTMLIWYLHSGYWLVWSYGEEGFNFLEPNFFKILFSFNRGWFIYTPLALLSLAGLVWLFRHRRFMFYWMTAFLVVFVYVASSWWVWTYTSNFGQRTFIDTYAVIALMLAFSRRLIGANILLRASAIAVSVLLITLNSLQFYQHYTYVFPPGELNFELYKDSFFRLTPKPRVYYPEGYIVSRNVFFNDFEDDYGWLNYGSVTDEEAFSGKFSSATGKSGNFSIGLYEDISTHLTTGYSRVRVSGMIKSDAAESGAVLVIEMEASGERAKYKPFFMDRFSRKNRWAFMEVAVEVPDIDSGVDNLRVYFHNDNPDERFYVDDLKIEVISLSIDY